MNLIFTLFALAKTSSGDGFKFGCNTPIEQSVLFFSNRAIMLELELYVYLQYHSKKSVEHLKFFGFSKIACMIVFCTFKTLDFTIQVGHTTYCWPALLTSYHSFSFLILLLHIHLL